MSNPVKDSATGGRCGPGAYSKRDMLKDQMEPAPLPMAEFECWTCPDSLSDQRYLQRHFPKLASDKEARCIAAGHDVREFPYLIGSRVSR